MIFFHLVIPFNFPVVLVYVYVREREREKEEERKRNLLHVLNSEDSASRIFEFPYQGICDAFWPCSITSTRGYPRL